MAFVTTHIMGDYAHMHEITCEVLGSHYHKHNNGEVVYELLLGCPDGKIIVKNINECKYIIEDFKRDW